MSRLTNDVENIQTSWPTASASCSRSLLSLMGVVVLYARASTCAGAGQPAGRCPLTFCRSPRTIAKRTRAGLPRDAGDAGQLNGMIEETITGQRMVKAFRPRARLIEQFTGVNRHLRQAVTQAHIFAGFIGPLMNVVNNLALAIVAGSAAGWRCRAGHRRHDRHLHQLRRPVRPAAEPDRQAVQHDPVGARRRRARVRDDRRAARGRRARGTVKPLAQIRGEVSFEDVTSATSRACRC